MLVNYLIVLSVCCFILCSGDLSTSEGPAKSENVFKSVPTTVKTFVNDTVLLPCYLTAEDVGGLYTVRWRKDGEDLAAAVGKRKPPPMNRILLHQNYSLEVNNLVPGDTGEYVCEIIRSHPWAPVRQVHSIEVLSPPEVTSIPELGLIHVRLGEVIDIGCKATGTPQPVISWVYDDVPMELVVHRDRLKFNATSRHLSGVYECVANNGVGEPARAQIKVVIDHAPIVWAENTWVHTALGVDTTLMCQVTASPSATVHWFHGHNPVHLHSRVNARSRGDKHLLRIKGVRDKELGMYTCKAENILGMAEVKIQLSGVANIAVFKTEKNSATQTAYTLIWEADSYSPIIEYKLWIRPYKERPTPKEGVAVVEGGLLWKQITVPGENNEGPVHTTSYVLKGLTPGTAYEAQVISRNKFGWSKPSSIYHFFTANRVDTKSTYFETALPPTIEIAVDHEEILRSNRTALFATVGLIDPVNVSSSFPPQKLNAANSLKCLDLFNCIFLMIIISLCRNVLFIN